MEGGELRVGERRGERGRKVVLMRYHGHDSPVVAGRKNASFPFACTSKYKALISRGNVSLLLLNLPFKILLGRSGLVNWTLSESSLCPSVHLSTVYKKRAW